MSEKCTNEDDNTQSSKEPMSCDRRKRKSCEINHQVALEVKRTRLSADGIASQEGSSAASEAAALGGVMPNGTSNVGDVIGVDHHADSPKSEDSSSSTTTSGVDVTDGATDSQTGDLDLARLEVINITDFVRFQPCDPAQPQQLKSAMKNGVASCGAVCKDEHVAGVKSIRKSIKFDVVREFRFNRIQSFVTMPSWGGLSLGMEKKHHGGRELALDRYRVERERSRRRKIRRWRKKQQVDVVTNSSSESGSDSEDDQGLDYLTMQPVPPERRRRMLQRSGYVIENDSVLVDNNIRQHRELCGCKCNGVCYPDTCACYTNGIGCQVDRLDFPCGCRRDQCWNPNGRTSFNVERVRKHFQQTMERLNMPHSSDHQYKLPPIGEEVKNSQHFSFGDFTLPPKREPPSRNQYHQWSMNQAMPYWTDNWNIWERYDPLALNHAPVMNSVDNYQHASFYGFQDLSSVHLQPNCPAEPPSTTIAPLMDHIAPIATQNCYEVQLNGQYGTPQDQQKSKTYSDLQSTLDKSINESERLSESSESGIGEENSESPNNSSPHVPTFQMCGSIETSMTVAYNDDSNNSLPVSVGSE